MKMNMMLQAKQVDRSTGGEDWKSIQDLIKEHFLVRSYQRGYRWQRVNVFDLLNDLCDFIHSEKILYSLQPLVVYESTQGVYHVVDGQQRLTTVSILIQKTQQPKWDSCSVTCLNTVYGEETVWNVGYL